MPLALPTLLLLGLVAMACVGPSDPNALAPCPSPPEPSVLARLEGDAGPRGGDPSRGTELFAAQCARCHAPRVAERESRLFRKYPRLDCPTTAASSPAYLHLAIAEGGVAIQRDELMKPFAEQLSPEEIADLVAYLLAGAG